MSSSSWWSRAPPTDMARVVRLRELYLGTEGAALFRHLLDGDAEFVEARTSALRRFAGEFDAPRLATGMPVPEMTVTDAYSAWAAVYDEMPNPLIEAERPLVHAATADLAVGRALDAGCGTGRHAEWLASAGHATTGIDATDAMLAVARAKAPTAEFRLGDLERLPVEDDAFDFAICALALTHLADPSQAITELARVVRPGGQVVLTDAHPTFVLIQGQALFPTPTGLAYVRNHVHLHGAYLRAFAAAGLSVLDCLEAPMDAQFGEGLLAEVADAATALWRDVPGVLVWSLRVAA